jgi:glycosyltransferase involved in cell wall biosynthesis
MPLAPVTVIVPSFNCGHLVTEAVESILAQTLRPEAVIVIDDGSTDDTGRRLADYRGQIQYVRQANRGVSAARNLGIERACSEFIAFLDADDVWHPRKLELQLPLLLTRPALGLLGTRVYPWPTQVHPKVPEQPGEEQISPIPWDRLATQNHLVTSTILIRRSIFDRTGGFDLSLQGPEDHDMWIRVAELTGVANLNLPLTGYRETPGSLSKHARRMEQGMLRILDKIDERGGWQGRPLLYREACSFVYHSCAFMYSEAGDHYAAIWRSLRSLVAIAIRRLPTHDSIRAFPASERGPDPPTDGPYSWIRTRSDL